MTPAGGAAPGRSFGNMFAYRQNLLPARAELSSLADLDAVGSVLPYGRGHSVGDVCLNEGGTLLSTGDSLRGVIAFDAASASLHCLAGTNFADIIALAAPHGLFPGVVPSTKYLTVGGAVANDVHGRDHVMRGTFGCWVDAIELVRSDGAAWVTREQNGPLFFATIGGLGLTGLIRSVKFRLKRIASPRLTSRRSPVFSLAEALARLQEPSDYEYRTVWLDGLARQPFSRGFIEESRHIAMAKPWPETACAVRRPRYTVPCNMPPGLVSHMTVGLFNKALLARLGRQAKEHTRHFEDDLYNMDALSHYPRLYGRGGLLELHGVFPLASCAAIPEFFRWIASQPVRPLFTIMKAFGGLASGGLLSFPMPGVTVVLDYKGGSASLAVARAAYEFIVHLGGRIYPAKDACLSAPLFAQQFPRLSEFLPHRDPRTSSSFWRRVHG